MFRMRDAYWSDYQRDVEGEWCATMKEAKASYKAALKAKRTAELARRSKQ
jgi:hypothetical protein